ncbi:MAG TPA: peptidoglycan recognition family protein [Candidatus Sulfotelmatobacter sp.]|nr:peptidoglycan recognition family protein [Candidatus Sulfotelmatobacter sp.]HWI59634.1 peptidoglycan recognition family protein [Bacillota bacterium]
MSIKSRLVGPVQVVGLLLAVAVVSGCKTAPQPGAFAPRQGDEIVVAGQLVHTGARVVLWMDPGGYDAYRVERRFSPLEKASWEASKEEVKDLSSPNRYNLRRNGLSDEEIERVRGGGWDLPTLQKVVDQFVLHYDVCGTSRQCFKVLHDMRDLSVHFMLDLDGTIYQTLDLKERAWHATQSNSRSIGIEIANMGAYGQKEKTPFDEWYHRETNCSTRITIPARFGDGGIRTKGFVGHPAHSEAVRGVTQGRELVQYDFTPEQYQALIKLTATLSKVFPKIKCDYPRDAAGRLITQKLPDEELNAYQGVMGHFHIQTNKVDPGPALQWDYVIDNARKLLNGGMSEMANQTSQGHMRARF